MIIGMEWIVVIVVIGIPLLFGPKKIPEFARAIGRAWAELRNARTHTEELKIDMNAEVERESR